jgi:hypothetical protein
MAAHLNTATLPAPTDDVERAEQDLAEHGICALTGVLSGEALSTARHDLYAAAANDRARDREAKFSLDYAHDDTNQRVWNVLSRSPVFVDLAEHPLALKLLRSVLGWPMLLGNLSANITGPGGGEMVLHADQIFIPTPWPDAPQGANAAWCLDDFTAENGATCFVPGTVHPPVTNRRPPSRWRRRPARSLCSKAASGTAPDSIARPTSGAPGCSAGTPARSIGHRRTGSCPSTRPCASSPPTTCSYFSAIAPKASASPTATPQPDRTCGEV